jgi:hypothetical protein
MTAATAAAASAAAGRGWRGLRRASTCRRTKHGKLNRSFFAGTLWAGNFLLLVQYNLLKLFLTFFANIFIDGHEVFLDRWTNLDYNAVSPVQNAKTPKESGFSSTSRLV